MKFSVTERLQFPYILPVQGTIHTLEQVECILEKVKVEDAKEDEKDIDFTAEELWFMCDMIQCLDQAGKISFSSLSLVRKILNM
jgi:hypothetical protein